jgi:hypothetical protein
MTKGPMNAVTMPSFRVDPELRQAVEDVLYEDESLSDFMGAALRAAVSRRRLRREVVSRALGSREQVRCDNEYFDADDVHAELARMPNVARQV